MYSSSVIAAWTPGTTSTLVTASAVTSIRASRVAGAAGSSSTADACAADGRARLERGDVCLGRLLQGDRDEPDPVGDRRVRAYRRHDHASSAGVSGSSGCVTRSGVWAGAAIQSDILPAAETADG